MGEDAQLKLTTILLEDEQVYSLSEGDLSVRNLSVEEIQHLSLADCHMPKANANQYGSLRGIYRIWKEVRKSYICVNAKDILPQVTQEELDQLSGGELGMILPRVYYSEKLQESYRKLYYGYDFRLMLSLLKKEYPKYYRHAKEEVLDTQELLLFGGIFRKEEFDRICAWVFTVLAKCEKYIPKHFSAAQHRVLEYLAPYLFTIYVTHWKEKHPYAAVRPEKLTVAEDIRDLEQETAMEILPDTASRKEVLTQIEVLMGKRKPEEATRLLNRLPKEREDLEDLRRLFARYERERRYYKETILDTVRDWHALMDMPEKPISPAVKSGAPRLLIFQWNSIGHKTNVKAFESFGFECHTIRIPYDRNTFDEDALVQLNRHLDFNQFDLAFSLNCIGFVAEACYIHDIPYIAWCYDSPTFTGARWYHYYPTTHIFLFDSDDARHYEEAGITQAHYMPLAVNLEYFEGIACSDADRERYRADVSFIGSLYDTSLPEAMGYLTDYQKGYLSALMDNQMDVYGHSFFPGILSGKFMEWLDHPEFNRLINAEFDKERANEDTAAAGRLQLLLNKQTTNRERMLLLNLLARYCEVKLYSYKNSEALQGLTFCGTADYYTEMPKIFRCSKINLNATLRSIRHGVPLRCLDVMGCHGLLLTNYQKDFDDHFMDGENVLFYTDAQEALEKARFYLAHDSLREKIAEAGYETVKKYYDYPLKIREILELAQLQHLIPHKMR